MIYSIENPHLLEIHQLMERLQTRTEAGLNENEAQRRQSEIGPNELIEKGRRSILSILMGQFTEVLVMILLAAAVFSFFLHEYIDASVILVIVVLNAILGFWQEYQAENAMAALKKLAVPTVRVRRGGVEKEISAKDLVPGDVIFLETGNVVPADARLVEAAHFKTQESALTGESESVEKNTDLLTGDHITLPDRKNMIYMGTVVVYGRALAVVTATGMQTELGKIATMLQTVQEDLTPLQKRLARLGGHLAGLALLLILIVAAVTYLQGVSLKETFLTAISMAVAAIPEGLPAVVTIALALGAQRMLKKKSLIRQLSAVETLGSVTVICSDKTGTLTQNKMAVTELVFPQKRVPIEEAARNPTKDASIQLLLLGGTLCNNASLKERESEGEIEGIGDPTESAIVIAAHRSGIVKKKIENDLPRIAELPFDSERKRMSTVHAFSNRSSPGGTSLAPFIKNKNDYVIFTKGAVDGLVEKCTHVLLGGRIKKLSSEIKKKITTENETMAKRGIRVLGTAFRTLESSKLDRTDQYEKDLVFIGMMGMMDPIRPEAKKAVHLCQKAGIRVVMITGDHPLTAMAIAHELDITQDGQCLTGEDLSRMDVKDLKKQIDDVSVFARVSPEHKMIIIDALREKSQIVAMTGDGVNDAPALKLADIGVAMGKIGTDVSRESANMVLLDDNFATIVAAVKEGRTIYDNIRKFIKYILTGNMGEIFVMLVGPLIGMPLPLVPVQILWINLVTDGAPAVALGYEEGEGNVMNRLPFRPGEGIFARGVGKQILWMGFLVGLVSLCVGFLFWKIDADNRHWQTMIFTTLTFCQMAYALCSRKTSESIFNRFIFNNRMMLLALIFTCTFQFLLIYVPFFRTVFNTEPLTGFEAIVCIAAACVVILASEIQKWIYRRKNVLAI